LPRVVPPPSAAPPGGSATLDGLHLPAGARVLVVPIPTATFTEPMRWQAESGQDIDLIGGYFTGPGPGGQAYIGGAGVAPSAQYLNVLWDGGVSPQVPSRAEMDRQLADWRPAAVLAVTGSRSALGKYLIGLLGPPSTRHGDILAWRR
jgi:hypothetical protein